MYRRNHLPFAPIPISPFGGIPISPFGGIPIAGVPYGFPVIINRPNNNNNLNNNLNYNGDIDINIIKKKNGSMLTPADTNYLKTKIHMLQIIFNIILNNLCFKNSNNNNQLVNQIKNDIASNSTVSNHLSDLCLSGSNTVASASAAAVAPSVVQAANAIVTATTGVAVPPNTLIDVLVAAQAEVVRIEVIHGLKSDELVAAGAIYTAIEASVIASINADTNVIAAAAGLGPPAMVTGLITTAVNTVTSSIKITIKNAITAAGAVTPIAVAAAITAATGIVAANPAKTAANTALGAPPTNATILTAFNNTPITVPFGSYIVNAATGAARPYTTAPAIVRKNPANQCFDPVFDDFKLHGLISSMRNNNFLRKACIYNSSRNGIDSNRIKINFAGGASSSNSSNTQDENFNFINLLNILKEKDQSPDKTAILCVQTNGKLKCSNIKKKESTTECEFCERWTRERNMFRSVLKDLLEASDFNNTFDLMSASAYLLPSAIMNQKQYEQFYTAIEAYKKAKKERSI
jgi:hypothetical protein